MKQFLLSLIVFSTLLVPVATLAATAVSNDCSSGTCSLDNPLGNKVAFTDIAGAIIRGLLGVIGSLTLLMFVWGGFQWLTSAGNAEKVESGSKTMIWAVIGVLLVFTSYFLLKTFTDFLHTGQ